jgi:fibronectin type 3 domain-containing protein
MDNLNHRGHKEKRSFPLLTFYFLLLTFFFLVSCGKKGPPTLKAYEKPEKPPGITAIHREERIILSWSYPDNLRNTLKGFQVLRSESDGFERVAFIKNDQSLFIDTTFKLNVTYQYKVIAQNLKDVLSADSNIITVIPKALPSPPENIRFTITSDSIELHWSSSGEGICYNIYKTTEKDKYADTPLNREPVCMISLRDTFLLPDRTVYYTIRALLNTMIRDEGYASTEVEVNPSHFIPSAPSDLRVVKGDDKVYLLWKENTETWVKGYRIYRKRDGQTEFTPIGEVTTPTFTDTEKINKKVWYMIKALGPSRESDAVTGEISEK